MRQSRCWIGVVVAWLALWPGLGWAQTSTSFTFHAGATSVTNGAVMSAANFSTIIVQVEGTFVGTVRFEKKTKSGSAYVAVQCTDANDRAIVSTTTSAPGYWECPGAAYSFRAAVTAYTSGTIVVSGMGTTAVAGRGGGGVASLIAGSEALPAEPCTIKQVYSEQIDGVATFYFCSDGTWTPVGAPVSTDLQGAADIGRIVGNAVNGATAVLIGSLDTDEYAGIFRDPTLGVRNTCRIAGVWDACDKGDLIKSGFRAFVSNENGDRMINWEPNASTPNAKYALGPLKARASVLIPLQPRGAATAATESIVSAQPSARYLTVNDSSSDAADFSFPVTGRMAGATTATFRLVGVSKNATPSGNIDLDCAMTSYTPGIDTFAAHSTSGEVTALLAPATQYRPVAVTTAAHTITGGALVAGDIVFGSCEVDATATTSTQMVDFRLWGYVLIALDVNSLSD